MAVKMEGMFSGIHVIYYYLNDLSSLEDERIRVRVIDSGVVGCGTGCESTIEGWNLWLDIGYVIKECAERGQRRAM